MTPTTSAIKQAELSRRLAEALAQRDEALERLATLGEWLSEKGFDVEDEIDLAIKLLAQFLCQSEQEAT